MDNRPVWSLPLRRYTPSSKLHGNAVKADEIVGRRKRLLRNLMRMPQCTQHRLTKRKTVQRGGNNPDRLASTE